MVYIATVRHASAVAGIGRPGYRIALGVTAGLLLAGCGDNGQNTLDPHSRPAHQITTLWWVMMVAAWIVLAGACFLLVLAWWRRQREGLPFLGQREEVSTKLVVVFGIVVPIVSVIILFVAANLEVIKVTEAPAKGDTTMTVDVIGRQWFWEFRYPNGGVVTADELHIPAGARVRAEVTSPDVIHSFWVPELNRKIDVIPGHPNAVLLNASKPGRFRGQCAEFCGLQHAHMSFSVIVDTPQRFRAWLASQATPARAPATPQQQAGRRLFMGNSCASCHAIAGTPAHGTVGPDLTHLASRASLAALTIPNDARHLLDWISDPQHIKPGVKMPGLALSPSEFRSIRDYLMSLK